LKSGLDEALAAMFSALVPIVEIVGTVLSYILKLMKGIYKAFKILTDFAKENGLYTAIMLVVLAVSGLILAFTRLGIVNSVVFLQMIANTIRLNALLWITRLRVLGIIGVFTYLLSQLDGFFVRGEEDNIFMTWYYTVQMLASELDLMFARFKYNMFMFKENPFDYTESFFYDKRDDSQYSLPEKIIRFFPNLVVDATKPIRDWREGLFTDTPAQAVQQNTLTDVGEWILREGFGIGRDIISPAQAVQQNTPTGVGERILRESIGRDIISPAQAVQQNTPTPVENKFFLNLGGLSLQDKTRLISGETVQIPTPLLRPSVLEYGGLGTNR